MTARVLSADHFSLELHHSGASSLSLPYRRWHVVSFYVGPTVRVARTGLRGHADAEFRCGSVGIYPAGQGERIEWQGPTTALHLHLCPVAIETLWREQGGIGPFRLRRVFSTRDSVLQSLGAGLYDCAGTVGTAYHSQIMELVLAIGQRVALRYTGGFDQASPLIGRATLDALLDEMHGAGAPTMSVAHLAEQAGLSERRFRQAFRSQFGASPHDYLVRCRLEHAKHLIQCNQVPLTTVAHAVGFYDQAHFSRTFKARIGISPSRYAEWLAQLTESAASVA